MKNIIAGIIADIIWLSFLSTLLTLIWNFVICNWFYVDSIVVYETAAFIIGIRTIRTYILEKKAFTYLP